LTATRWRPITSSQRQCRLSVPSQQRATGDGWTRRVTGEPQPLTFTLTTAASIAHPSRRRVHCVRMRCGPWAERASRPFLCAYYWYWGVGARRTRARLAGSPARTGASASASASACRAPREAGRAVPVARCFALLAAPAPHRFGVGLADAKRDEMAYPLRSLRGEARGPDRYPCCAAAALFFGYARSSV